MFNDAFDWYDKVSLVVIIFVLVCGSILFIWTKYIEYKAKNYSQKANNEVENRED